MNYGLINRPGESAVRRIPLAIILAATLIWGAAASPASAADMSGGSVTATPVAAHYRNPRICRQVWACSAEGCGWQTVCRTGCPDRYSCYPLYGAYGPYGGQGYWGGYTDSGWGRRW
jgi:hypothetical protein